jgi:hypothetical protein
MAVVLVCALLALTLGPGAAAAATAGNGKDQVVITGGLVVPAGQTVDDVVVLDGPVRVAGHATGNVIAISGKVTVTGRVDGDVAAVSDRAFLGPAARVGGDLLYGDERPVLAAGARVDGSVSKKGWEDELNRPTWGWIGRLAWWLAVSVSTLVVGALLLALAPRALRAAEEVGRRHLGMAMGWGVLVALGLPALAIAALVTLVGIPFGIGLLLALAPLFAAAYATAAWMLGRRLVREPASPWLALLAGWGILRALALIPVAGFIVGLLATITGLGALAVALWRSRRPGAPAARPEAPTPGSAAAA